MTKAGKNTGKNHVSTESRDKLRELSGEAPKRENNNNKQTNKTIVGRRIRESEVRMNSNWDRAHHTETRESQQTNLFGFRHVS